MTDRRVLREWLIEALRELGGAGSVLRVSKVVWERHEADLRLAGDLLFTWQYDLRWAANALRTEGVLDKVHGARNRPWTLKRSVL